ncbi:MAG: GGDEF domain-containing protein [Sutterellaceae bacterium]|nr:GGDEF domain-containing protein [Burkholderiaceae bacterium]MDW8430297.1 GGDEF domain-containing protein [Sutterellaceae bacterium]
MDAAASVDADAAPASHDRLARDRTRRQRRLLLGLAAASFALDTLLLLAFSALGVLAPLRALAYGAAGALSTAFFLALDLSGFSDRQRDPYLTVPSVWLNSTLIVAAASWMPQVGPLLLMLLFIVLAFGALRLSRRDVVAVLAVLAPALALVLLAAGTEFSVPMHTVAERLLTAGWIVSVLARCMLLGLYGAHIRTQLNLRNQQLRQAHAEVHRLATRDDLTGLLNRRSILQCAQTQAAASGALAVALLDIDHFKRINDTLGHPAGDEVLRQFGLVVAREMRVTDRAGRFGGEEFLVLLRGVNDPVTAARIAERLRAAIEQHRWRDIDASLAVTASVGVAVLRPGEPVERAIARADRALYEAKHAGRNRVRVG